MKFVHRRVQSVMDDCQDAVGSFRLGNRDLFTLLLWDTFENPVGSDASRGPSDSDANSIEIRSPDR